MKTQLTLFAVLVSSIAQAATGLNVQYFTPSTSDRFVLIEDGFRGDWPKNQKWYFGLNYNYVNEPLVVINAAQNRQLSRVIDHLQTVDAFVGFRASDRLGLFFGAPIFHYLNYNASNVFLRQGSVSAFGDMRVLAKIRLTNAGSDTAIALIPELRLPTGNSENFVSDASTIVMARLAGEHRFGALTLNANLGFMSAPNSIYTPSLAYETIDMRKRMLVGAGAYYSINDIWGTSLEWSSQHPLNPNSSIDPNEFYAGLRYAVKPNLILTGGGSVGNVNGPTGQNFRIIAGLRYTGVEEEPVYEIPAPGPVENPVENVEPAVEPPAVEPVVQQPVPTPIVEEKKPEPAPVPLPQEELKPIAVTKTAILHAQRIEILKPILFENNSARIKGNSRDVLDDVALIIRRNPKAIKTVYIDGHTSQIGTPAFNQKLSINRSKSVKNYLVRKGVAKNKLVTRGFGESRPKVNPKTNGAAEVNRRVEFLVVKP